VYVYIYIYMYIYVYVYIYIYTYQIIADAIAAETRIFEFFMRSTDATLLLMQGYAAGLFNEGMYIVRTVFSLSK
jgi:hypothetical protein